MHKGSSESARKMQPNDPREVTNMSANYGAPKKTLRLMPAALLLSIAGLSLARPAVAAEVRDDPGGKGCFTYCYAHPPALRMKPGDSVMTGTRDCSHQAVSVSLKTVSPTLN